MAKLNNFKLAKIPIDNFVLAILCAVLISFIFPQLGTKNSPIRLDLIAKYGVTIVFFLHGANLSFDAIAKGAANWKLHIFVQSITFIIFPIIGFIIFFVFKDLLPLSIRLGFFFLCALSSTISSSVTMTAIGKGNVAGAVFDATISGILGMMITPFLMSIIMKSNKIAEFDTFDAMLKISKTLLLPFILGQLLRPLLKNLIEKYRKIVILTDRATILLIVFVAFCNANLEKIWQKSGPIEILFIALIVAIILGFILFFSFKLAKFFGFNHQDMVAGVFASSTKSLANGAPIAAILFAGNPMMGMILLPIMLYHQFQLIACSILAGKWGETIKSQ